MQEIERIHSMEAILDNLTVAKSDLVKAMAAFREMQGDLKLLSDYYGSKDFFHDLEMDEKGMLPKDLKRGVLSEDAVYDLMGEIREMTDEMHQLAEMALNHIRKDDVT